MKILHFNELVEFQKKTKDFLMVSEAENNLPLGILANIIAGEYIESKPYLALVGDVDQCNFQINKKRTRPDENNWFTRWNDLALFY